MLKQDSLYGQMLLSNHRFTMKLYMVSFFLSLAFSLCAANQMSGFYMKCTTGLKMKMNYTQLAITCSKLTIETPKQGVKYVQI